MTVDPETAAATYEYKGTGYYFCAVRCKERFAADPESFLAPESPTESKSQTPDPKSKAQI